MKKKMWIERYNNYAINQQLIKDMKFDNYNQNTILAQ